VTALLLAFVVALACSTGYLLARELRRRRAEASITPSATRILFPFVGEALSTPALDAALRLARAEGAMLVPAYLAIVPLSVQLDTPLKKQAETALPLLEAIEQRAATQGVPVDSRLEPGRSVRQAFRFLMDHESFDRVVAAAAANGDGFSADDVAWLLEQVPGEILILRPSRKPEAEPPSRRAQEWTRRALRQTEPAARNRDDGVVISRPAAPSSG
jgi:nucleotide-binding universal stress UspA family protein